LGTLWAYYQPDQVTFISPPGATIAYVWGDKTIEFHHCRVCGCTTHWEAVKKIGADRLAVNARLMEIETLENIPVRKFDGASSWAYLD
jgi:hypothetical protein